MYRTPTTSHPPTTTTPGTNFNVGPRWGYDLPHHQLQLICILPCASKTYTFVDLQLTWTEAQQFCRKNFTDLVTISSQEDISRLPRPTNFTGLAWIGLFDDPASWYRAMTADANSWRWSATGTTSPAAFMIWKSTEPNFKNAAQSCGAHSLGAFMDSDCTSKFPFVCFTGSTEKQFFIVNSPYSTWLDALAHCRANYTDLAMIENADENQRVTDVLTPYGHYSYSVWIGLYREPWMWSDHTLRSYTNWVPGAPNNFYTNEHCTVERSTHQWDDVNCNSKYPFYCHKDDARAEEVVTEEVVSSTALN
ncbi:hypothetical protein WMY93_027775 [Mugilogobius chulae]|uniref:C-type lectin domain-containing protein n=1 Tax=Mugilogobius chulae TaxID=88201 RepID=A0AAW0N5T9_9GOBI